MMSKFPLISIALCTYNGEQFLEEQLDSLINQTYPNLEIIAVDDYSSDSTRNILIRYQQLHPHLKPIFNEHNLGFNKNFEKAISLCSGEYIAISDQDDIWVDHKIDALMSKIGSYDLVYSNSLLIDKDGKEVGKTMLDKNRLYTGADPRVFSIQNMVSGHSLLFRKRIIGNIENAFFPEHFYYDWWLVYLATSQQGITGTKEIYTYYRKHDNSVIAEKERSKRSMADSRDRIVAILEIPNLKHRRFFEELLLLFNLKINNKMHLGLFLFLLKNMPIVTNLSTKSFLSKLNRLRQEFI